VSPTEPPTEDLADLIQRVMDEQQITQTEIAARSGISTSTLNAWITRQRGTTRGPSRSKLTALASALGLPEERVFTAAGRRRPGPLSPGQEEQLLTYFRELTAEQQADKLAEVETLARRNRTRP
jgi:transcriptional regulator with XRE-family HTH domain